MAKRSIRPSRHVGGCTFAENPALSCASVLPVWSGKIDPRVLKVRADRLTFGCRLYAFNLDDLESRTLIRAGREFVRIDLANTIVRLDVVRGTLLNGPVSLCFEIPETRGLRWQMDALRTYLAVRRSQELRPESRTRLLERLLALQAFDLRREGARLRSIAETLAAPGDWPGDGEHRKSRVRRLISSGEALVRAGPSAVLRS